MAEKTDQQKERTPTPSPVPGTKPGERIDEGGQRGSTKHESPQKQGVTDTHETPPPK